MEERGDAILHPLSPRRHPRAAALGRRRGPVMHGEKERGERGGGGAARRREASPEEERRRRRTPGRGAGARRRRSGAGKGARFVTGGGRFGSQRRHGGRRHGRASVGAAPSPVEEQRRTNSKGILHLPLPLAVGEREKWIAGGLL
jgi:hypothetical protein